ncbi:hypothetical protein PAMP_006468 [Pampus punctatissimus]
MEESFKKELSENENTWRKKLALSVKEEGSQRENSSGESSSLRKRFQKELSEVVERSRKALATLSESWKSGAQQWKKKRRELEETLLSSCSTAALQPLSKPDAFSPPTGLRHFHLTLNYHFIFHLPPELAMRLGRTASSPDNGGDNQ